MEISLAVISSSCETDSRANSFRKLEGGGKMTLPVGTRDALAGGFQNGDKVRSLADEPQIHVVIGDVGTVVGSCSNAEIANSVQRVCVDFGVGKGRLNVMAKSRIEHVVLAGGFQKGDKVRSLADMPQIHVVAGDIGTVLGPCSNTEIVNSAQRVCVDFGACKGRLNVMAKSRIEHVVLAGGFQKGDKVRSLADEPLIHVVTGNVGTVVGPCSNAEIADSVQRVCVDFGAGKGRLNVMVKRRIEHVVLAGGFQKGDKVRSLADMPQIHVVAGDMGTVVGPCNNAKLDNSAQRVCVDIGAGKGEINMRHSLEYVPLTGGFQEGDKVRSLADDAQLNLVTGNVVDVAFIGTVVGPCSNDNLDNSAQRVCVDFGAGKGKINMWNGIEHVPLAGGFQKGDKVRSLADEPQIHMVTGDVDTVVGPCSNDNFANSAQRVCVDIGAGKRRLNVVANGRIEHVVLAGGFQKGDRVRSLIDFAGKSMTKGEQGTVVGPCNRDFTDKEMCICIDFGAGKGRVDFYAMPANLEHVPLAGGFLKGDIVRSMIDFAGKNVIKGDEGTVVGPCDSDIKDREKIVCINFGAGKGRVNFSALPKNLERVRALMPSFPSGRCEDTCVPAVGRITRRIVAVQSYRRGGVRV